jgi:hypothetical protein
LVEVEQLLFSFAFADELLFKKLKKKSHLATKKIRQSGSHQQDLEGP